METEQYMEEQMRQQEAFQLEQSYRETIYEPEESLRVQEGQVKEIYEDP